MQQGNPCRPRARLITTAWGDRYVEELFSVTLAAALAPGNLPAIVDQLDCEVIILTELTRFDELRRHPVFCAIEQLCRVELRPVDEFITRPDAYGMALTYALFRGFEDLGDDMVNVHFLFLNSDFVLADGSFRTVARKILEGERLILAPSYCVVAEVVGPELARRRNSKTLAISVPPRELADLGIRHRHNTIRGKTINQQLFSMEWIDQFYWLVDQETLLARQMPIAVVSMRPERVLTEMVTFWDYGIISEACPTTRRCIIADSDDFLMIELRSADTARNQIRLGRQSTEHIAKKLYRFITADPIELACHTLVLHSSDLPVDLVQAEAKLDHYVSSVLAYLPRPMDYRGHYIWQYHYPTFQKLRGAYLASAGTPLPWDVEELVERPALPTEDVLDAAFATAWAEAAPATSDDTALSRHHDVTEAMSLSHPRGRDLESVWRAVGDESPGRVLVVNSRGLSTRLFADDRGSPVEFEGLPDSIDARLWDPSRDLHTSSGLNGLFLNGGCDLCLCEIDTIDLLGLRHFVETVSKLMRSGAKIYVSYLNPKAGPLTLPAEIFETDALALELPSRVSFLSAERRTDGLEFSDWPTCSAPHGASRGHLELFPGPTRAGSRQNPSQPRFTVFDAPPDECVSMTIEIDVTLKHTGPSPAIRLKTPPPIATTRNVDMQSYRVPAGNRVAQDLASKLALLKAENLAIIAERSRLIAEREREIQLAERAATERSRLIAERDRDAQLAIAERSHLIAERDRDAQLAAAQNAALVSRIKDLEDHNRLLTKTATESARQLQERTQTDYQILMAQQQLLAGMKDTDPAFHDIYERCKDYTMTSVERLYALYKSVEYIVGAGLGGDFVETGVWRGGSCMLIAETLIALDDTSRRIFLFDTFEGHPKPDAEKDVDIWGNRAIEEWDRRMTEAQSWADVSIDEARANMARTGYPANRIFFVKGMVEETVPRASEIGDLVLLRLDTDWYDSARVSLEYLFPRLVEGGVLIMDDYGHYKGQQQALDEYLAAEKQHLLLNRIDYSCRVAVKGRTGAPNANTPD